MIGKQVLTISAADFAKGSSSSDYAQDGGFSPLSTGLNLNIKQGVVYSVPTPTDASTNVAGQFIASCSNGGTLLSSVRRYFIDGSANFYTLTGSVVTKQVTGSGTYNAVLSDLVAFQGSYYASTTSNVTLWNGTTTIDEVWWGTTKSMGALNAFPHPLIVYKNILFIADGQYVRSWDGTTATAIKLDLGAGQVIYAFGIDPGTGSMLISTSVGQNVFQTNSARDFVWLFDGFSVLPSRSVPVNDLAMSFHSIGETVFVGMSRGIGIWTGAGIQMIHQFLTINYSSAFLPYKAHITNIGNVLYFIDNKTVFAYGEVSQANNLWMRALKVFYPCFQAIVGSAVGTNISLVTDIGAGALGVFYQTGGAVNKFEILDMTTAGSGGVFYSNRYEFPRPISVHKIRVFTTGVTASTSAGQVGINNDENGNTIIATASNMSTTGTKTWFDFDFGGQKLQMAQLYVVLGFAGLGLNRILMYYDISE